MGRGPLIQPRRYRTQQDFLSDALPEGLCGRITMLRVRPKNVHQHVCVDGGDHAPPRKSARISSVGRSSVRHPIT